MLDPPNAMGDGMSRVADDADDLFSEVGDEDEPLDVLLMEEVAEIVDRAFSQDTLEVPFGYAEFERCTLRQVSFAGTHWAHASFDGCTFSSWDFTGVHMAISFLRNCRLSDCRLTGADFHGSYIERVSVERRADFVPPFNRMADRRDGRLWSAVMSIASVVIGWLLGLVSAGVLTSLR